VLRWNKRRVTATYSGLLTRRIGRKLRLLKFGRCFSTLKRGFNKNLCRISWTVFFSNVPGLVSSCYRRPHSWILFRSNSASSPSPCSHRHVHSSRNQTTHEAIVKKDFGRFTSDAIYLYQCHSSESSQDCPPHIGIVLQVLTRHYIRNRINGSSAPEVVLA